MNILITGASGFIGKELCKSLCHDNYFVRAIIRENSKEKNVAASDKIIIDEINSTMNWQDELEDIDCVIYLAGRVHIMRDHVNNPLQEFQEANTFSPLNLAKQASLVGVKRFIYLSSIKVNGEATKPYTYFTEDTNYIPVDAYALSKYEAEQGLSHIAQKTQMEVVIIRPPLVYGQNVKANFLSIMKVLYKRIPLPFGAVHNQRSLVALDNLVSFIIHCIDHPKAANEIFLISDGEDVSTTELLHKVAKAFGKKTFLVPVPVSLMRFTAKLLGKEDVADRLFGSLQVDSTKAMNLLGWKPVISMDEQLKKTADAYLNNEKTF
jgi:nucleoside-diphosphate-sugar epimerase